VRILRPTFPEPTDQVIQNLTIGDGWVTPSAIPDDVFAPWQDLGNNWQGESVMQGEWTTSSLPTLPLPRTFVTAPEPVLPALEVGPVMYAGGVYRMAPIARPPQANPMVDPAQRFLAQSVQLDSLGNLYGLFGQLIPTSTEVEFSRVLSNDNTFAPRLPTSPRTEIVPKLIRVAPTLPSGFGRKIAPYNNPVLSYQLFTINGATVTGGAAVVAGATVYLWYLNTLYTTLTSDGSGLFSIPVRNAGFQLTAYKVGSPDIAGLTRNDVVPTATLTTIYMRDPTAPDSGGGGNTYSRGRVVNV
jgi:hypothetical protein